MKMHRTLLLLVLAAAATFATLPQAAAQATSWQQVPIPSLPAFKPQQPKRIQLSNGMVIFLQEDHELPLIDGTARIRGGSVNEPANKVGLIGYLRRSLAHRRHQDPDRRSTRRLPRSPRGQGGNRQQF